MNRRGRIKFYITPGGMAMGRVHGRGRQGTLRRRRATEMAGTSGRKKHTGGGQ